MCSEIQKVYYAANTFSICSVGSSIHHFLRIPTAHVRTWDGSKSVNPEAFGSMPYIIPSAHVRSLQVRIKAEHFPVLTSTQTSQLDKAAHEERFYRLLQDDLSGLLSLIAYTAQNRPSIEFIVMTSLEGSESSARERHILNLLEAMRSTVYSLMHDGDGCTIHITHADDLLSPFGRNVTNVFSLTKEQWYRVSTSIRYVISFVAPGTSSWT